MQEHESKMARKYLRKNERNKQVYFLKLLKPAGLPHSHILSPELCPVEAIIH